MSADYRQLSLWFDALAEGGRDALERRPALVEDTTADVCIVGAGLTGLWTAYYLIRDNPGVRIVILEAQTTAFGASGRNGGWASALFPLSTSALAQRYGAAAAVRMRRAMIDTVDEVGRVSAAEGIDCDYRKGGTVSFVRNRPGLTAAHAEVDEARRYGVDRVELLGSSRTRQRFGGADALAATVTPDCARIQPAALARALADRLEASGVRIFEGTRVTGWRRGRVDAVGDASAYVMVHADKIVNATEAYASALPGSRRTVMPLYSLMIATERLSDAFWDHAGIEHGQTFTDFRHLLIYGQRTADNRFAFGGRGARYHWGSAIRPGYDRDAGVARHLRRALIDLFPEAADASVTHSWGGPIGVPRDWHASVGFDRERAIGWAGGYVGDGLSTTNLAGRTLAQLLVGTESELTRLPWVDHRSPLWEPEPLRFLGANAGLLTMRAADAEESLTHRRSLAARLMSPLTGG